MKKIIAISVLICALGTTVCPYLHKDFYGDGVLACQNRRELVALYKQFLKERIVNLQLAEDVCNREYRQECQMLSVLLEERAEKTEKLAQLFSHLDIGLSLKRIKRIHEKHRVIQLRKINSATQHLIIGCGNRPLSDSGGTIMVKPFKLEALLYSKREVQDYRDVHKHNGMITIDYDITKNPTVVGMIGAQLLSIFYDEQFKYIVSEGVGFYSFRDLPYAREELIRIRDTNFGVYIEQRLCKKNGEFNLKGKKYRSLDECFGQTYVEETKKKLNLVESNPVKVKEPSCCGRCCLYSGCILELLWRGIC